MQIYQPTPSRFARVATFFLVALLSFVAGWQATSYGLLEAQVSSSVEKVDGELNGGNAPDDVDMGLFWTIWKEVENKYVDPKAIDETNLVYGAIKGMVDALDDPYTSFMTPDESKAFSNSLEGTLVGIGAELEVSNEQLVVVAPLKGSPAEKSGLMPGDIIIEINGDNAADMSLIEAVQKIRGEKGTTVTLTLVRKDLKKSFEVSIVRDDIDIESVTMEKLDNGIVYLSVNQFNDKTNEQFNKAISEMVLNEPKGLVVDLRFNGGGYLDIAMELLSYVLPEKTEVVTIKERGEDDQKMYTNGNTKLLNVPLVVLVNEASASASEIFAGAIQYHKRGIIMGTKTFGKGSVQEVESFSDGSSMRITIAKWFVPDGVNVNKVGLSPDILVEISEADIEKKFDSQKQAAIDYLLNLK